jgi:hypothetical protein
VTASPFLAPSLVRLRSAINAAWPNRSKAVDGWIGDAAHQATQSDHNPDDRGMVHAIDVTAAGIHVPTVLAWVMGHPYPSYTIHNERIWDRDDKFWPHRYNGTNPHTDHIHISIAYTNLAETGPSPWGGFAWAGVLGQGATGLDVRELQAYLNGHFDAVAVDGAFGPLTGAAVRRFQSKARIAVDGLVGPITRNALRTLGDVG